MGCQAYRTRESVCKYRNFQQISARRMMRPRDAKDSRILQTPTVPSAVSEFAADCAGAREDKTLALLAFSPPPPRLIGRRRILRSALREAGWWAMTGSNRRPVPCKGNALPLS